MLGDITAADEIYIVTGRTDMRKSIDGLCAIVEDQLHMDPRRSALYLFCGKRCDRIKALLWESDGFVLLYKRMEVQGRFRWPRNQLEVKQLGVPLSRATLANWIIYCVENYLRHVYDYFHRQLRMRKYLMADETRVQVLNEPERNPETDSWMWLFRSGEDGLPPILLYHYTETRAKFHAASFLQGFSGYLETDGYQGYNNLPDIKRCSCWAHVRRYFTDAIPKGKEYDYSLPAVQGVQFCSKLFDCERYSKAKNHTAEQRKQFRLEKEKPILEAFWNWLDQQRPNKGTRLAKAVNYAQNRKDTLMTYLEDGHCSLSNNLSENAIRPFTVGRKNGLFSASPKGATASAIVYTMVEMAKANDLNTYKYLTYLLSQRPDDKMSDEQLEQLAPWSETAKADCQN